MKKFKAYRYQNSTKWRLREKKHIFKWYDYPICFNSKMEICNWINTQMPTLTEWTVLFVDNVKYDD